MHMATLRATSGLAKSASSGLSAAVCAAVFLSSALLADQQPSRKDAELLKQKIATITAQGEPTGSGRAGSEKASGQRAGGQRARAAVRRTTVTENELNAYLVFDAQEQLPVGVVEPFVNILGIGRISGRAVVDLDAVRKQRTSSSLFDPTSYLRGRLPVTATGTLSTNDGMGQFQLESASVGGIPIPKVFLQEIVSYYSRTPDNPAGIALEDPFALPARIREIQVERGQAVIVQ
jgi:hypothetical protein